VINKSQLGVAAEDRAVVVLHMVGEMVWRKKNESFEAQMNFAVRRLALR
jgi:hypothetical protein